MPATLESAIGTARKQDHDDATDEPRDRREQADFEHVIHATFADHDRHEEIHAVDREARCAVDQAENVDPGIAQHLPKGVEAALMRRRGMLDERTLDDRSIVLRWMVWPVQACLPLAFAAGCLRHGIYAVDPALRPQERGEGDVA